MLLEKLKEGVFTTSQKHVVDYLLNHLNELSLLSINDLAKYTYTSNATIMRLCHHLGYSGYRTFKLALLQELEAHKYIIEDVDYTIPFQTNEPTEVIIKNMFSLYQESIQSVYQNINLKTIETIASHIVNKKRIFIYAYGDSQITALTFINKLIKLNIYPILATEYHEEVYMTHHIQKDDFVLFITYRGYNGHLLECAQLLNRKGIKIALMTSNEKTPLRPYSQYQLFIPDLEKNNKIATFYSQLSFMYLLNNIYAVVYQMIK